MNKIILNLKQLVPQKLINSLWHFPKAMIASYLYGNPGKDLNIIAITGTDGKTTTTTLIYHILRSAREKTALITTVEAKIGRKRIDTGLHVTSPDPFKLQALLRKMRSQKIKYLCLEVTSHGLDQYRLYPIKPKIAVLTNITHEHLDYHKTFDNYINAKLKIFKSAEHAIINKDAKIYPTMKTKLGDMVFATYSIDHESQLQAKDVQLLKTKIKFRAGEVNYEVPLTGKYNLYNTLAAISTALILGISPTDIKRALRTFKGIKGRMDFKTVKNRSIVIDFAHTPNALKEALTNLRNIKGKNGKLIAVFGSAGRRDTSKRPLMGAVASELADEIILTAEDPRGEKVTSINKEISSGFSRQVKYRDIPDRSKAITYAITKLSVPGDMIAIFGKGHEKSLNIDGKHEVVWSDHKIVDQAIELL